MDWKSKNMPRHPNNSPGAPNNIRFDESLRMSYVFKQPDNNEELVAIRNAINFCPVEAVVEDKSYDEIITNRNI
jgi:hypothetical protein